MEYDKEAQIKNNPDGMNMVSPDYSFSLESFGTEITVQQYREISNGVYVSDRIQVDNDDWLITKYHDRYTQGQMSHRKSLSICRHIPFSRLYTEIENKTLTLISPSAWNDPFESLFYDPNKLTSDGYYMLGALCFSYNTFLGEESAWTVYGKDEPVVKIRIDFNNFVAELSKIAGREEIRFYFSICDYSKQRKEIEKICNSFKKNPHPTLSEYLNAMSFKRMAFDYEYEIRLFVVSKKPKCCFPNASDKHISFDMDYCNVVSSVFLPPLKPYNDARKFVYKNLQQIQNEGMKEYLGCRFPAIKIYQSQLYWIDTLNKVKNNYNQSTMIATREDVLKKRFNKFWNCILRTSGIDYYGKMCLQQFLGLKTALNDIHSIITLKVTLRFVELLLSNGVIDSQQHQFICNTINATSPNANGYDVEYSDSKMNLVAEVKCNVPVKGNQFGSAQQNSILKDIDYLTKGKSKSKLAPSLLSQCLKFLVLLDMDGSVRNAIAKLPTNNKNNLKEFTGGVLDMKYVYVVYISL